MFYRLHNGWQLAKQSIGVLRLDKELLVFPLLSGLACLVVLASFALPLWNTDYLQVIWDENPAGQGGRLISDPLAYVLLFAFYFANYFVIVLFNSALVACAVIRLRGGDPTVRDGLRAAAARLPQILAWALLSATVSVILRVIESRSEKVGKIVAGLAGMAWGVATYFVVPVLVVEKVGPGQAIRRSLQILRKTWGEALAANFGIGLVVSLLTLAALVPAGVGVLMGSVTARILGIAATVLLIILISLVSSALQGIVLGALYLYAADGRAPAAFDQNLLEEAFVRR
jgi:hypothetical protein